MRRSRSNPDLTPVDPEPERTLRRLRNLAKRIVETSTLDQLDNLQEEYQADLQSFQEDNSENPKPAPTVKKMVKLSDHSLPESGALPKGFTMPGDATKSFEFKASFLNLIERNQFGGGAKEDPYEHIQVFVDYCSTIHQPGITQSKIRETLFPFSLTGRARKWITDLNKEALGLDSWEKLALAFYNKYFPPEKTAQLRSQITNFRQANDESLHEAWERFKDLVRSCPHHGLKEWFLVMQFYGGLFMESRKTLDYSANGRFANNVEDDAAWNMIEDIAIHDAQYCSQRTNSKKYGHEANAIDTLSSQMSMLMEKINDLHGGKTHTVNAMASQSPASCEGCGLLGHTFTECRSGQEQVNAFQAYRQGGSPYSNFYNENTKFHPNFSWKNQNTLNPTTSAPIQPSYQAPPQPPGFQKPNYQSNYQPNYQKPTYTPPPNYAPPQPSNEFAELKAFMLQSQKDQNAQNDRMAQLLIQNQKDSNDKLAHLTAYTKMLETQIAQMATSSSTRQPGQLPPKGTQPNETVNAITLRSGTNYEGPKMPQEERVVEEEDKVEEIENSEKTSSEPTGFSKNRSVLPQKPAGLPKNRSVFPETSPNVEKSTPKVPVKQIEIKLPYPCRQVSQKVESQFNKFLVLVKDLHVQMPFMDVLLQFPSYAKFMKDILSRKRNWSETETVAFTEESTSMVKGHSAPKLGDPGSFTIPCDIGKFHIENALCDLGASISVMPYAMYKRINAGSLKSTSATVQLADRSVKHIRGILEDMPVKIGKFFVPVDFIVLEMAESEQIPIILGRPFLNTAGAVIDVNKGRMTLEVGGETINFNMNTPTQPMVQEAKSLKLQEAKSPELKSHDAYESILFLGSHNRDPFDTLMSMSCDTDSNSRPPEKPPSRTSSVQGKCDPMKSVDPGWKSNHEMTDKDFYNYGERPPDFMGTKYDDPMTHLFDTPGKGADGEP